MMMTNSGPLWRHADTGILTRRGPVELAIPQIRDCATSFYPKAFEKGQRSEKALTLAVAEMYLQGESTRRVTAVLEKLCGTSISSTEVSRVAAQLDPLLEQWRVRPLDPMRYLFIDARYEKVRVGGTVRSCAVLIAIGIREADGRRVILGVSVSLSEAEVHWREFLQTLRDRGIGTPAMTISDAHPGLKAARAAVFSGVPWQRGQFHLQQNAQAYIPRADQKLVVAGEIRRILDAASLRWVRSMSVSQTTRVQCIGFFISHGSVETAGSLFMVKLAGSYRRRGDRPLPCGMSCDTPMLLCWFRQDFFVDPYCRFRVLQFCPQRVAHEVTHDLAEVSRIPNDAIVGFLLPESAAPAKMLIDPTGREFFPGTGKFLQWPARQGVAYGMNMVGHNGEGGHPAAFVVKMKHGVGNRPARGGIAQHATAKPLIQPVFQLCQAFALIGFRFLPERRWKHSAMGLACGLHPHGVFGCCFAHFL